MPGFAVKAERDALVKDALTAFDGVQRIEAERDVLCIHVRKETLPAVLRKLRDELGFQFLTTLCGMHFPGEELELGVVYHLHNMREGHRIRVKSRTAPGDPEFRTVVDLWPAANWMEREAWDFFGIRFTGHPNLKRILNMEDFPAFPLRKDYPLEDPTRQDKNDSFFGR
jgi:NADH-quinone oxidoreductase subunit C